MSTVFAVVANVVLLYHICMCLNELLSAKASCQHFYSACCFTVNVFIIKEGKPQSVNCGDVIMTAAILKPVVV